MKNINRRTFNSTLIKGIGGISIASQLPFELIKTGKNKDSLGVALVGLGGYSNGQLGPALLETEHCHLAGIVTGTPSKASSWAKKYSIQKENIYNYENFDLISKNEEIDVVYVVLPNSMHADFCIRAAQAGKHVICEKPMAISVVECDAIIDACKASNVKLSVGYRLQSEPYTLEVKRIVREKVFGDIQYVSADAGYNSRGNPDQWRLDYALSGGGALMNMGVYAIQSAIYGSGQNPVTVSAQQFSTRPAYFKDTDEAIAAQFEFPSGAIGNIFTSHNANVNRLYSSFDRGWVELNPANNYGPLSGRRSDGEIIKFPHKRQQALQMDDFAKHIQSGSINRAPGEMGKRDMIIVEAIYQSIKENGAKIDLNLGRLGIVE